MPYKSKRNYRRRSRRRYKRRSRSMFAKTTKSPLGKRFLFKTRYYEQGVAVNPGAGGLANADVYSLTGLYDPNISGVGHQPLGFDEIMPLYDHYCVIGARARVDFYSDVNTDINQVGLYISDTNTTVPDATRIIENGLGKYGLIGQADNNGKPFKSFTINFSTKKFFSMNPKDEADMKGTIATNPAEQAYLHVWGAQPSGIDTANIYYTLTIEYIALLSEPKMLISS